MPTAISNGTHNESKDDLSVALDADSIPTHPLGVKPLGNQYLTDGPNSRANIGGWRLLPDEVITLILENFDQKCLLNLGHTCKFFYAFCHSEELWKSLFLQYVPIRS